MPSRAAITKLSKKYGKPLVKAWVTAMGPELTNKNLESLCKETINEVKKRKKLTAKEKAKGRSENYHSMSAEDQWAEDKKLGILDWDGE